jgi:hypothetical protein
LANKGKKKGRSAVPRPFPNPSLSLGLT